MLFSDKILNWYDLNRRQMPWRAAAGEERDPYRVWLSEIMLQQTTVATVKSYFLKFLVFWPNVGAMANAELDDILTAWAGLGYYARARNLHLCAKMIVDQHDSQFPRDITALQKLPGIGPYTSGAIAAIAFDQPVSAVDGNVERVLSRYFAIKEPLPLSKPAIKKHADALVPQKRAGDFAQGMMDLGATICTPRKPHCGLCPLKEKCLGLKRGLAETLPLKLPKKPRPTRWAKAFVIQRGDRAILLRRRPPKGLLGGMLEVPCSPWVEAKDIIAGQNCIEHTFTHFHLVLEVVASDNIDFAEERPGDTHEWVQPEQLTNKALPTVMKKVLAKALGADLEADVLK